MTTTFLNTSRNAVTIPFGRTVDNANYILARLNGVWQAMGTGANA
jgi:hypothetical protein